MRYLGGKARIARHVVDVIERYRPADAPVWEPFCGGLNVTAELARRGVVVLASDASVPLIALLCAVRDGWTPPETLSEAEWKAARALPPSDPLHGFAGFTAFGGDYGGSYALPKRDNHFDQTRRALLRDVPLVTARGAIALIDFLVVNPGPTDAIIYCDPPYAGRTGYAGAPPFNRARFVARVAERSRYTTVFVSEYAFPLGECVWTHERAAALRGRDKTHVERIYRVDTRDEGAR